MTLEDLVARSKAAVLLSVNDHRSVYKSESEAIGDLIEDGSEIDDDLHRRIMKGGNIYELQFYPNTPIGFHRVIGTSLDEVLRKAEEALESGS